MNKNDRKKTICLIRSINNSGSTLITVIVAIAFVTILTSIILGSSVVNVRMKTIDRSAKDEFYYAERSLNDIFTGLGQKIAKIAGDEYEKAFEKVGYEDAVNDYNIAETAEKEFRKNFLEKTIAFLNTIDDTGDLEDYIQPLSAGKVDSIGDKEYQKKDGTVCTLTEAERVVFRNVKVSAASTTTGYRVVISTDIVIDIPTVDFLGTNADVSDYGLIANEGLYVSGEGGNCTIIGNVYAGVHHTPITARPDDGANGGEKFHDDVFTEKTDDTSRDGIYGGINIRDGMVEFDGNYIVSKGDISLAGTNPRIKVKSAGSDVNLANLWFTSIRTLSGASITNPATQPTIDINANVFALNDMILNTDNSSVVIKGNYYGYNENLPNMLGEKTGREDARNSAIIINGRKSSLDMREINNFVLMGKAYIDFTSDDNTQTGSTKTPTEIVPTAEAVALKTNQQLYLVPPDFLSGPNPAEGDSISFSISIPDASLQNWFGYQYLDPSQIHKAYKVTASTAMGGETVIWYDYLVFNETTNWKPKRVSGSIVKDPVYNTDVYEPSTDALGTGGSISSKTKFFYDIINARKAYEYAYEHNTDVAFPHSTTPGDADYMSLDDYIEAKESAPTMVQPSAYRLYERINRSMDYTYFDLAQCVVGDMAHSDDAHYYAKNAVVNYERDAYTHNIISNVLSNTDGMGRYASYTGNLFKRYMMLCTRLNSNEDKLLEVDPAPGKGVTNTDWPEWKMTYTPSTDAAPICHFVKLDNIDDSFSITDSISAAGSPEVGLRPGVYGVCIAQRGDLDLSSLPPVAWTGNTFKGVAIVDGDITVPSGKNVEGLLMATGTITLKGNNRIQYDKGLIQSRIEKEMDLVKNSSESKADAYKNYYLINYLAKDNPAPAATPKYVLIYDIEPGTKIKRDRIEADYNEFMYYENWQKSE